MAENNKIQYPYLPEGREIKHVSLNNPWMQLARKMADELSGCIWWPTGAVVVKDGNLIGQGANQGELQTSCMRQEKKCPTGTGYEYCHDICKQQGHAEVIATNNTLAAGNDPQGADLYLFGHWWCCQNCWDQIIKVGITNVYLLENAHEIFSSAKRMVHYEKIVVKGKDGEKITRTDIAWEIN